MFIFYMLDFSIAGGLQKHKELIQKFEALKMPLTGRQEASSSGDSAPIIKNKTYPDTLCTKNFNSLHSARIHTYVQLVNEIMDSGFEAKLNHHFYRYPCLAETYKTRKNIWHESDKTHNSDFLEFNCKKLIDIMVTIYPNGYLVRDWNDFVNTKRGLSK